MANKIPRVPVREQDPAIRATNFEEVCYGYDLEEATLEASRCLRCKNPRCVAACPVGIRIPDFIAALHEGRLQEAADIISEDSSLPSICGRVCPQESQCEGSCILGIKSEPVAVGKLERFVGDWKLEHGAAAHRTAPRNGRRVAVIGSGPAGLACASDLAKMGYGVKIFEALHKVGGVLVYGIPEFRLPKQRIVAREIAEVERLGVEIETDVIVGRTVTVDSLLGEEGYDAVFIGSGAGLPRFMGIPGENLNIKRVKAITEGERGEIFMGNASGLYRQTGLSDELEAMFPDRINTSVNALGYVNSTLFAATNTGLFAIDFTKNRMQRYLLNPDVMSSANNLTALHITPSGDVWGASARGLHHFLTDKGEFQHFPFNGVFSPSDIVSIGDTLFVASRGGGILPFIMSKGTRLPLINLGNNIVTAMSVREGLLIASTDGTGVFIIDPATGDALHHLHFNGKTDDVLRSNSVYSVLADDMGLLWVGYYQDGVQYTPLRRDIFTAYHPATSTDTRNMAVRAVAVEGPLSLIHISEPTRH